MRRASAKRVPFVLDFPSKKSRRSVWAKPSLLGCRLCWCRLVSLHTPTNFNCDFARKKTSTLRAAPECISSRAITIPGTQYNNNSKTPQFTGFLYNGKPKCIRLVAIFRQKTLRVFGTSWRYKGEHIPQESCVYQLFKMQQTLWDTFPFCKPVRLDSGALATERFRCKSCILLPILPSVRTAAVNWRGTPTIDIPFSVEWLTVEKNVLLYQYTR